MIMITMTSMMMIMTMIITSNDDKNDNDGDEIMTVTMKTMAKMITTASMIDAKTEMVTMLMTVTARQALTTPPPAGAT